MKSNPKWQSFTNKFDHNSLSTPQQTQQQDHQAQYGYRVKDNFNNHNNLITHDKDHFQEYLSKEGLNHQLRSKTKQDDMSDLQFCLSLFTDLDVLDENNKFVCRTCTQCEYILLY